MSYIPNDSSIARQSVITVNCTVARSIVEERQDISSNAPSGWQVIGGALIDGPRLQIRQDEPVVARITDMSGIKEKRAQELEVFSSFNGIALPPGMTQEQFEDQYICVGFAASSNNPEGDPPGTMDSIAVIRAGSGTTYNNSDEVFYPGDVFGWKLPSVNKEKRARQVEITAKFRSTSERTDVGKHVPILTKITYSQINDKMDLAVQRLLEVGPSLSVPRYMKKMRIGSSAVMEENDEMAINLKRMFAFAQYSAIVIGVEKGITNFDPNFLNSLNGSSSYSMLAHLLGLTESTTAAEDPSLYMPFFRRVFYSSLGSSSSFDIAEATRDLNSEFGPPQARSASTSFVFTRAPTVRDDVASIAKSASNGLARVYGQALNRVMRKKLGTVSSFSAPGARLDYARY